MKILVTGATGFVGHHTVEALLRQGHEVVTTSTSLDKARQHSWFSQVQFIDYTIGTTDEGQNLFTYFGCPDVLVHLAWPDVARPQDDIHIRQHLLQQFTFLKNLLGNGLLTLVVAGTCFEYGMQYGPLNESTPTAPVTPYGLAKDLLQKLLAAVRKTQPFRLIWLRLFYVHGEGQHPNSLLAQLGRALDERAATFNMSGGEQLRDYLPVAELADLIGRSAVQTRVEGVINCCSGKPISLRRLVESYLHEHQATIALNLGYYPYRDFEPMAFWGTTDKLKGALNND